MKTHAHLLNLRSFHPRHHRRARLLPIALLGGILAFAGIGPALAAELVVNIRDNFFSPKQRSIAVNDTVRWVNQGNNDHTTTSTTGVWNSGTLHKGDEFSVTFNDAGTFPYFCQIHGQAMSGTIKVGTNSSGATQTNLFLVNVSLRVRTTNDLGKVVSSPETSKDLVADCAEDQQLDAADLSLVYDRATDAIEVVRNSDGSIVCTMIRFVGGANVVAADGKRRERQAFVYFEESQAANGSMVGTETITQDAGGALLKYSLRGSIQFGLENYEDDPPSVFQGTFSTGRKFVPRP